MKIIKPDAMAVVHRALRLQGADRLCVGLVACFPLATARLDALLPEVSLWQALAQSPGAPAVLDEGLPKARGEFMAYGEACAPGGKAVTQMGVGVRVGALRKQLLVHGDRRWSAIGTVSAALPFTRLPIGPQTAFGGPGDARNPSGKGLASSDGTRWLPNVEDPRQPITFSDDRPEPAGFWGVDSSAPQRQRHLGAVDKRWLQRTWPHLPEGTSADYFQSAPPDQRLAGGCFVGDETIELSNLNAEQARIDSALPGLRGRCFAWRGNGADARFEEIETQAETVWLMPGLGLGAVLYRGALAVDDEEAADVRCVVAGWEPMREAPWPESHYREQLPADLAAPKVGAVTAAAAAAAAAAAGQGATEAAAAAAPPAKGATAGVADEPLPAAAATPTPDAGLAEIEQLGARIDAQTDALLAEHGIPRAQIDAMLQPAPVPEISLAEIEAMTADKDAQWAAALARNGLTQADVDAFVQSRQALSPVTTSLADIDAQTQAMRMQTEQAMRANGIDHEDVARFLASRGASVEAVELMRRFPLGQDFGRARSIVPTRAAPDVAAAAPAAAAEAAAAAPAAAADIAARPRVPTTREEVVAWHAEQRSFEGLDLPGLDLGDLDLSGADFSDATLQNTRFDGSRLVGTRFDRAVLQGASLERADATKASFQAARAAGSRLAGATLAGASLAAADFNGADFSAANLAEANCTRTEFSGSRMAGLRAAKMQAVQADFSACGLEGADLRGATLTAARFGAARMESAHLGSIDAERSEWYEAQASQADFAGANLRGARAGAGTVFAGANLSGADLDGAAFSDGVEMEGASLHSASLAGADFSRARGAGLRLTGANLRGADFSRAALQGADASGADLMGASLRHAQVRGARFDHANLHGSDCYGSTIAQANTADALTTATLMRIPGRPEAGPA